MYVIVFMKMPRKARKLFRRLGRCFERSFTNFLIWTCTANNFETAEDDYSDIPDTDNSVFRDSRTKTSVEYT
uniref:Uncharacterized protein n=1 Tax=Octopus bimaculoides TaxID=37653 RepID=A0A0L8FFW3_OCTBM